VTLAYYIGMRLALREAPSHKERTRCRRCGIFFVTDPRNRNRSDLCCPFGCRQLRIQSLSNERSSEYNRTEIGRNKKKQINSRRNKSVSSENPPQSLAPPIYDLEKSPPILSYITQVVRVVTGKRYSAGDVWLMLVSILRQHSLDNWGYCAYFQGAGDFRPP